MKNSFVIGSLASTLSKVSENIEMMVRNTNETDQQAPELSVVYEDMILDELAHAQIIILQLTKMLTGSEDAENGDETAFMEGELTSKKPPGEKQTRPFS